MVFGIGTDIIEVVRIERELMRGIGFKEKIFSVREIEYCESKRFPAQNYAARFAAKEALFKALGTGWRNGQTFRDIEILGNALGNPEISLSGKTEEFYKQNNLKNIQVSISHIKEYATAFVTIEQ
jgi:holo-[acyl-carrier protein] synthase